MPAARQIIADDTRLSRADRLLYRLETLLAMFGGIVILLLVFFATANILGRWLLSLPISGYIDWVEQAMAFFAFLGLAYTQRNGEHIRMDIVIGNMRGRPLWLAELLSTLLMLGVTVVLIYGSYLHFFRAWQIGDSSLDIHLPTWPAKLVVPVALALLALRLVLHSVGYARACVHGGPRPVAVPLARTAAAAAAAEAESALGEEGENGDDGDDNGEQKP